MMFRMNFGSPAAPPTYRCRTSLRSRERRASLGACDFLARSRIHKCPNCSRKPMQSRIRVSLRRLDYRSWRHFRMEDHSSHPTSRACRKSRVTRRFSLTRTMLRVSSLGFGGYFRTSRFGPDWLKTGRSVPPRSRGPVPPRVQCRLYDLPSKAETDLSEIGVVGIWHQGAVLCAGLASLGHKVRGVANRET